MTFNQIFRLMVFLFGVFVLSELLAAGTWSVKEYGTTLDVSGAPLTALGGFRQFTLAANQEMPARPATLTIALVPLYVFSLIMTFTLLRHKPNYLVLVGAMAAVAVSAALTTRAVDLALVLTLTPAFLFLLAWGVAIGPAWEKR